MPKPIAACICRLPTGRIEVHSPHKLESMVLPKYFRHSKFASFQRQLNYFGFRKLAGKGKMAPCSYVNEGATQDIGSLLLIKVFSSDLLSTKPTWPSSHIFLLSLHSGKPPSRPKTKPVVSKGQKGLRPRPRTFLPVPQQDWPIKCRVHLVQSLPYPTATAV